RFDSVVALRLFSLLFASIQFVLIARRSLLAGALIALYPPAALFAVDARSYALCALFVTIGVLQLETRPFAAALAFALAAHTHYYGVLFFPVLLFRPRVSPRSRSRSCSSFPASSWRRSSRATPRSGFTRPCSRR
ncbi:MAG: hypothetical protein ACXW19_12540, partial [Thermoanaerobaculia bacterium]